MPSIGGNQAWDLILRNSGRSAAYDLRLTVSAWPEEDILTKALRTMFETPQTLPPNTSIRSYWSLGPSKHPRSSHPVGFDQPVDLTVTYKSDNREASEYRDTFRLDSTVLGMTPMGASGIEQPNGATPHEKKMREIVRALNEMRRGN
ncbi:hypothetical protein [Arthrobacter crystallopoietes]|uniref:hypothetical protein n=1 Tax=Crystallibacter crystallopoietes TaxID=37928 RepID=UPI0011115A43|nr:hypothetical protein [Arthrobacter crystallopoietes]QTG81536.1 hypothetical protein J5251_02690 [Arthrobacter crystallopoietes]